jgi:hypothetical protein
MVNKFRGDKEALVKALNAYENRFRTQRDLASIMRAYENYNDKHNTELQFDTNLMKKIGAKRDLKIAKRHAKGWGIRVTKTVNGRRIPKTAREIMNNVERSKGYFKLDNRNSNDPVRLRIMAKMMGIRLTKNVNGRRVRKTDSELARDTRRA